MAGTFKWKIAQQLEIRWWKKYLSGKDVPDYLNWKRDYWNNFLQSLEGLPDLSIPMKILDAGCGPAGIFMVLGNHDVTAADPLLDSYEEGLDHFSSDMYPDVTFLKSRIEDLVPDESFDMIFCLNAINHVEDIDRSFNILFGCLRPGGTLVISIDSHRSALLKKLFRLIPGDALHPHQYDLAEYGTFITDRKGTIVGQKLLKPGRIFDYYAIIARKA